MVVIESDDPERSLEQILATANQAGVTGLKSLSTQIMEERQPLLFKQYSGRWAAIRYRFGADPYVEISSTLNDLMDNVMEHYPRTWKYFCYRKLLSSTIANREGH